jgi:hypothetical protein
MLDLPILTLAQNLFVSNCGRALDLSRNTLTGRQQGRRNDQAQEPQNGKKR